MSTAASPIARERPPKDARRSKPNSSRVNAASGELDATRQRLPLPVILLLVSLQIPWIINLGALRLTPYRLVLLILVPLLLVRWAKGGAGKVRLTDLALFGLCVWCTLAILVIHGLGETIEPAGIYFIETMGGFLVARCYIRDENAFFQMAKLLFIITLVLLPFAMHETFTGGKVLLQTLQLVMPTYEMIAMPQRWGLDRAQVNYIHPIHFGLNIGCTLTLAWMVVGYGKPLIKRLFAAGLVFFTSFLSLSSGPLSSMVGQIGLMGWGWVLQRFPLKWSLMAAGGITLFVLTELFANRSMAVILLSMFAFDADSAYIRTLTWEYGTQSIMNNPLFGVGFNMWDKPAWLTESIDMHWIIDAVRHGIPAGILTFLALGSALWAIGRVFLTDDKLRTFRAAYMFTIAGFFMTGWAVYFWESTYVLFTFLLGSGFWLLDREEEPLRKRFKARPNQADRIAERRRSRA